ncbi:MULTISPECIES: bifunctional biotin--[acetyl-CoA-carboxylase] ligase/biotin operon repressor BirA [unclassified Pseudoalteromonas]|uniref:bifunctional biotin--[acetyl-CoA-carboxylase] ligase/biotin operon repressor BirA n=1 Tax=Pseudoalteromonas TaxID=53246 RepID=UPI001601CC2F|nr:MULTISPECIES: bifunctional biotin--[acetyl-CoA-carboxylase] ligase/biotin operon repressor BirA [unclassified Pseudoalteromonas]MBB1295381.1 bifunctional biotin--[acetyl-CoA-carboxylase] ligase/biotin operon repressor BirA [Pseudoalteromonas sp. SR41-4]MBB1303779.1 bifunctional biotin--[acetyl-CoA-carboxylase] ligase/biotin operon repressor BirA [Pseudoalteromonas sp. SR44-8]MBB1310486.1 bifunctional biotin--[acetyl-CoA-carboxylase] ligase/biotin operon repressor BirA [Pseudoalteromonas sp. S|tara:strand:+ start:7336 stop:8328 length:993 start_codon:yes stop_codon:yes gene_type:complete
MKAPDGNKLAILNALNQGGFISGQLLGEQLGISRAAVSKHMQSLQAMGLDIFKVSGKGYSLNNSVGLLEQNKIQQYYQGLNASTAHIEVHPIIDSTNSELMRRIAAKQTLDSGTVVVAEMQQAGRGRRGRVWQSPFGANLYYSYFWRLDDGLQAAMGMSIAVGLAVYDTLKALYQLDIELKWPNDIYLNKEKLAGVLVELDGQPQGPCQLVIGVGINLQMPTSYSQQIDQAWTDLSQHSQQIDKNQLVAHLTYHLEQRLAQYSQTGLHDMYQQWNELNAFAGQCVELNTGHRSWRGICEGIDPQGGIRIRQDGEVKSYYGGEISLRKAVQ